MSASEYADRAKAYARRVVAGEETAGPYERLACQRFLRDLERQDTPGFPYRFDAARGARACRFIELMPHIKGEWARPVYVDGALQYAKLRLEDWQVFTEVQLFGWLSCDLLRAPPAAPGDADGAAEVEAVDRPNPDAGLRRFKRSYEEIARKNAKSTRIAARALYMATADNEPGAQCYSAATTGDQAREVFDVARNMAIREPRFLARFGVTVGKNDITIPEKASNFRPINAEGSTLDGLNVHFASVDELHAHKTRDVWDVLDSATGARSQPLLSAITTAGSNRAGICYELRDYTIKVLTGVVDDPSWFGVIYTIDEGDLWHDPAVWRKANPNLGVSVRLSDMEAAQRKALNTPSAQANFLAKHLNVWVNSDTAWMDMAAWDRCADNSLTAERVAHLPCWVPCDLASKVDVAALPLLFWDKDAQHLYIVSRGRFYLPERAIEQGRNSQYDGWRRSGHLVVTDGDTIDFSVIEQQLRDDMAALRVQEIPFDPWQATALSNNMLADGAPMVEMRATVANFSEPMKTLEAWVLQGRVTHDGNPMLTWMVSNVVAHLDAKENIYPRKERAENKIDGAVATIMGIGRILATREPQSFWEVLDHASA